ncbi:alpha/beta fold hydrolase [Fulvivirga sp.]|uniref:alpha/beta hydrolase family protein n=1 Tax=Fulvivirga sp. TaxID=1931237 RepID=UPI0032F008EA
MKILKLRLLPILIINVFTHSSYGIDPDRNYILTPDSIGWSYEQAVVVTEDGAQINTWTYAANPKTDKDTVLILAYPDAGNMSYFVYQAATLANAGYTVVTFDYRGFGQSTDFKIDPNYLYYTEFSNDLEVVAGKTAKKFKNKKLGIWCMSMGTTVTTRAYPNIKEDIDFIIGEGFVTDTSMIVERYKRLNKEIILPESSMIYSSAIKSIQVPILIFSASDDTITTTSDALELKDLLINACNVIEYSGKHLQGFQAFIDSKGFGGWYIENINSFLSEI